MEKTWRDYWREANQSDTSDTHSSQPIYTTGTTSWSPSFCGEFMASPWRIKASSSLVFLCCWLSFNWFLIESAVHSCHWDGVFWVFNLQISWFIPRVCDYYNYVAFVIGGYRVDVFLGENITLKQWMLPGTMRLSWGGVWYVGTLVVETVCMHGYVCVSCTACLFIFLHPARPQRACRPQRRRCLAVCSASVMRVYVYLSVCACLLGERLWCGAPALSLRPVMPLCGSYWAGTFRMTSANGDKADRSGRLWLLQEKGYSPKCVFVCGFEYTHMQFFTSIFL